jgi:hypothetical protein
VLILEAENQNAITSERMFGRTGLLDVLGARESEDTQALAARVRVSGRVCLRHEDIASPMHCTCAGYPAYFGELPRLASDFFELGFGSEMLSKRGPYFLHCRGLLEYPNPSVPDVYHKMQPRRHRASHYITPRALPALISC